MVLTMHGGGKPQSTLQARKKALNPRRKTECTCAQMMGKPPDIKFGIQRESGTYVEKVGGNM